MPPLPLFAAATNENWLAFQLCIAQAFYRHEECVEIEMGDMTAEKHGGGGFFLK